VQGRFYSDIKCKGVSVVATVSVYTSKSIGSSEGNSVSFTWCFASVIQYLQCPVATKSA
jgi:hypothetical protein